MKLILSILFSTFSIFGTSFIIQNDSKLIFNHPFLSCFSFGIFFLIYYYIIKYLYKKLDEEKTKEYRIKTKFFRYFDEHPFIFSMIFIIVLWLPYIISFYPIILSPDPSFQIKQYFGIPNKYMDYSIMIDKSVTITNHHPVIHTLLLGTCLKIGTLINNDNLGLFLYSIIQILILSSVLSFTIKYLKKKNISFRYRLICLLIYSLVPVFPFYAMSGVKDVIFGCLIILYTITIYELISKDYLSLKNFLLYLILMIFLFLFRNNGIHVIILSFPFVIIFNKDLRKKIFVLFILVIGCYFSYSKLILPYFRITNTSIRETLSIPFQQTARYVKYYDKQITKEERKIIDKILVYDTLASRYKPEISDPVKNKFNKEYTNEDLKAYFILWFNQFKKHPIVYFDATVNNVYGYFYPIKTNWYIYYKYDTRIVEDGFDYHYNNLEKLRKILSSFAIVFPYLPIVGFVVNIGFNTWILMFMASYLFDRKLFRKSVFLFPGFVLVLVCIASPVNTYFRYALPYIFSMPLLIGLFIHTIIYNNKCNT